jgi:hypothetical protein
MEKKNKRRNRIIVGIGIGTLTFIGGVILYKKCPKVRGIVDLGVSKVVGMCKGTTESKLPDFKTKPRTYKTYNGKNI